MNTLFIPAVGTKIQLVANWRFLLLKNRLNMNFIDVDFFKKKKQLLKEAEKADAIFRECIKIEKDSSGHYYDDGSGMSEVAKSLLLENKAASNKYLNYAYYGTDERFEYTLPVGTILEFDTYYMLKGNAHSISLKFDGPNKRKFRITVDLEYINKIRYIPYISP